MTSNPGIVGALILVPIAIAGSVAFVAIKTNHFFQKTSTQCRALFAWPRKYRTKQRRSDVSTSQAYADSWYDLESTNSREEAGSTQQPVSGDSLSKPEIKRPEPLRIVKEHANTIAGSSQSGEISTPQRGILGRSGTFEASPEGPHRSLTVFKRRRSRASVLDKSLEWNSYGAPILPGVTHKAVLRRFSRGPGHFTTMTEQDLVRSKSVGSFLKSELFQRSSDSEPDKCHSRAVRLNLQDLKEKFNPSDGGLNQCLALADINPDQHMAYKTPHRRQSLRKRLVSKAVDGLGNVRSKSMHFLRSKSSKESLLRRVSLRTLDTSHMMSSESSRSSSRFSFEQDSIFISDSAALTSTSTIPSKHSFILYPEIVVIPEVDSVDAGDEASIWVAVVITGVLRKTSEYDEILPITLSSAGSPILKTNDINSEEGDYGHLHGVDITLAGCKGSILENVVAEQIQPKFLRLGQTDLTLAKVKLAVNRRKSSHARESSKELIAELESRLGNATTEYLSIGISYKHSSFPTSRSTTAPVGGLSYHSTTIRIEAQAILKRHCSQSLWSHRISCDPYVKNMQNPLPDLINALCNGEKAARLLSKISDPFTVKGSLQQDVENDYCSNSPSGTVTPTKNAIENLAQSLLPISTPKQSLDITQAQFHNPDSVIEPAGLNPRSDLDPARKIWSDMRKTSRGTGAHSSQAGESLESWKINSSSDIELKMQEKQARIMEIALRNKRSLGAETLRSMAAPSMSIGIGMGKSWGWSSPWW